MRRAVHVPGIHEISCSERESISAVGVPNLKDWTSHGFAFNVNTNPFGVPPASITDQLFRDPDDPRGGGLGFTKTELYSPRYFTFKGPLRNDQRCPYG